MPISESVIGSGVARALSENSLKEFGKLSSMSFEMYTVETGPNVAGLPTTLTPGVVSKIVDKTSEQVPLELKATPQAVSEIWPEADVLAP